MASGLSKAELRERARTRRAPRPAHVEALDGDVLVRPLSGADLEEFLSDMEPDERPDAEAYGLMRKWIARLVVEESGEPLFDGGADPVLLELSIPQMLDLFKSVADGAGVADVEADAGKVGGTLGGVGGSGLPSSGAAP